jgi:hypothetical protein
MRRVEGGDEGGTQRARKRLVSKESEKTAGPAFPSKGNPTGRRGAESSSEECPSVPGDDPSNTPAHAGRSKGQPSTLAYS